MKLWSKNREDVEKVLGWIKDRSGLAEAVLRASRNSMCMCRALKVFFFWYSVI